MQEKKKKEKKTKPKTAAFMYKFFIITWNLQEFSLFLINIWDTPDETEY